MSRQPLIELRDIRKRYVVGDGVLEVLRGVTLDINAGEFVAIMGPSGSGKSTLMQIIGLLDRSSAGTYRLFGKDVSRLSDDETASLRSTSLGFIFQMFNLLARTTALDNVLLPMIYSGQGRQIDRARALLGQVGLEDRTLHRPNQLSGGQQQRVAIARSLVNQPRLLLADEPTGNLASDQAEDILKKLRELNAQGITVVLVTHEPDIAEKADRIIRVKDGLIVEDTRLRASTEVPESAPPKTRPPSLFAGLIEQFRSAVRAMTANKVRSGLSVLGILIGVAAVIAMLAIGSGAQKSVEARISGMGSNLIMLIPGSPLSGGVRGDSSTYSRLTEDDAAAIGQLPGVKRVDENVSGNVQAVYGAQNENVSVTGATPLYAPMRSSEPYFGRFFTDDENNSMARVAVLGQSTVNNLFGKSDPVGKSIKLNRINFEVIGVLPPKGAGGFRDQDDVIIVPVKTGMRRLLGKRFLNTIAVEAIGPDAINSVMDDVSTLMRRRHHLPPQKEDDFQLRSMTEFQQALTGTTKTFTALLGIVAAISLLVGGIGIMNIMLVSVSERTREIGLRKAVGATRDAILTQFLIEASLLSTAGGLTGILLGGGVSLIISSVAGWAADVSPTSVILSAGFSIAVGLVFGYWPARKASLLSPIEALRYE